mgnify:CR=1 FL=1
MLGPLSVSTLLEILRVYRRTAEAIAEIEVSTLLEILQGVSWLLET